MDPVAAKYIGAGLAAIGTGAAGIGVGTLFGHFLNGALRNPSAVDGQFGRLIFGFAVTEALARVDHERPAASPDVERDTRARRRVADTDLAGG